MLHTVQVRYYAQLREALQTSEESLEILFPISENDLIQSLITKYPKQRDLLASSRIAVNENYISAETLIDAISFIDVISPIIGG